MTFGTRRDSNFNAHHCIAFPARHQITATKEKLFVIDRKTRRFNNPHVFLVFFNNVDLCSVPLQFDSQTSLKWNQLKTQHKPRNSFDFQVHIFTPENVRRKKPYT